MANYRLDTISKRLAARYIPNGAIKVALKDGSAVVYLYEAAGKPFAVAYRGTAGHNEFHHSYRTVESRSAHVAEWLKGVQETQAYRTARRAHKTAQPNTYKVGDIVYTSWGYDQTNVDFFIVTRRSDSCVWVRPIAADYEATGFMCGRTWPAMPVRMCGDETRHRVIGGHFRINGHGASMAKGDVYSSSYA